MTSHLSAGLLAAIAVLGLGFATPLAAEARTSDQPGLQQIQFDRFPDRGGYGERDRGRDDRDFRGQKWRPGQVLPGQFLDRIVGDWEDRGLSRPPDGHRWVRVGQQFILVRVRDQMIARILNFD